MLKKAASVDWFSSRFGLLPTVATSAAAVDDSSASKATAALSASSGADLT